MLIFRRFKIVLAFSVLALLASACGSDATTVADQVDDGASDTAAAAPDSDAATDADDVSPDDDDDAGADAMDDAEDDAGDEPPVDDADDEDPAPTEDDETTDEEDPAPAEDDETTEGGDDELSMMLGFFGVDDVDEVAACVRSEADSEGMSETDLLESGGGIIVALFRCSPDNMREQMFGEFSEIDSSGISATPAQIDCSFNAVFDFFAALPLTDADQIMDSGDAPQEMVDALVDTCDISEDDANFLLNEA